ncbi:crotonobetainyl-CoA:carnitine CoA-transferase CaiB-like acyl-CoA transferase [Bacillus niacini]|uniref:Crotonobetainyl-CoA:carnitine CoA-transferase CaiB-like acyl-CoA transferase n=1 Tax=Neobacillus niacini TaxID=86668 RepID=A0A852T9B0_9BACI|nr:CoA transferase [Neobacillus niacini]NYE04078.1 crotonobetainyl-CoA:carnitine CoA-transferase CaiB-like acyl-CoA transferase [Neobacillus niacini]
MLPLEGIRVLDLTRLLPGPYCSLLLADYGADVIKVEDPKSGDYARWYEPRVNDHQSAMFISLNRNKRSITLDLKAEKDKDAFISLVKTADVLIESFRPGVMERLGLGYEQLKVHNPKLIFCAITGYGQTGPYAKEAGHDLNFLSYSGLLHLQGAPNEKPLIPSVQIGDIGGGALMAAVGILLAIINAKNTNTGQFVDISMLDGALSWMHTILPNYWTSGEMPNRGELTLNGGKACYEIYRTKDDRFISVGALEYKFWENFCKVIGKEELIDQLEEPLEQQRIMKQEVQTAIQQKTLTEWLELFEGIDACVSPVLTPEELADHPQIKHRQMIENITHPEMGVIKQIGNPIKLSNSTVTTRRHAPGLGEHTNEILKELGF